MRSVSFLASITLVLFLAVFQNYLTIHRAITYVLNRSAYKKRKKGQNFLDWLLFRRYKDILPKKYFLHYYLSFVFYIIAMLVTLVLDFCGVDEFYFRIPLGIYFGWLGLTSILIYYSWFDWKKRDLDPGRTIIRKRRNKK